MPRNLLRANRPAPAQLWQSSQVLILAARHACHHRLLQRPRRGHAVTNHISNKCIFDIKIERNVSSSAFFRIRQKSVRILFWWNPYEKSVRIFFQEKLTEICLFLTRKIVKKIRMDFSKKKYMQLCLLFNWKTVRKIRTDFSKKTRTSLSSFHWENRTENSYGFQRKNRTT